MSKSAITIDPIAPGEVLGEEFLAPLGLSASAFAKVLGVPRNRITRIVAGETAITPETALLFARALGTTPEFWMNLQSFYELQVARRSTTLAARVAAVPVINAAA